MIDPLPLLACYVDPRFLAKVELWTHTGCWIWQKSVDADGYGRYYHAGRTHHAHRYAYEQVYGAVPKGRILRHTCHCRQCCNPEHLLLGSQADNVADRDRRGNAPRGERNGRAMLTAGSVQSIRSRLAAGESPTAIASEHHVSPRAIRHIRSSSTWAHLIS